MQRRNSHIWLLVAALLALVVATGLPAEARQLAKQQKEAAASGAQTSGGSVPLRVGLVISDATRSYKTMIMLTRIEFGRRLAEKATKIFDETFASVRPMTELPSGPQGYSGLDLVVVVEVGDGHTQTPFLGTPTYFLTARFTVFNANGQQILQTQHSANDKGSPASGPDSVGEATVRKFIQELILNPTIRAMLAPAPAAPVETKPVPADTALMDSAGLDVPPPAPWPTAGGQNLPGKP